MRIPLGVTLESRDGGVTKDAKTLNAIVEVKGEEDVRLRKRPGNADLGLVKAGTAQLLFNWNGINAILADHFMRGTITTIVSGPTDTSLLPSNASLMWQAAATNNDAATPRLMFKNRTQAKYMNRAGTISAITYASNMGAGTYSIITLTRSGATATATLAEDVFNVGDTVTVAGATDAAYNGAKTVTAVTAGSTIPAVDIPITITRSGTTATATTVSGSAHGLTTATAYTIAGANQSQYNGSKTITTSGGSTFTYTVTVTTNTATWNPADKSNNIVLSGGNLQGVQGNSFGNDGLVRGTLAKTTGKWYFEVTFSSVTTSHLLVGIAKSSESTATFPGATANGWSYKDDGTLQHNGSSSGPATYAVGDIIGVAADLDSGWLYFYKNGVFQGQFSGITSGTYYPCAGAAATGGVGSSSCGWTANFGATAFAYTPLSGHVAWTSDDPISPATGTITVTKPGVTVNPTFSYTVAGTPATPDGGASKTAAADGGTVPGITYINGWFSVMDNNGVIWTSASDNPSSWPALQFVTAHFENGAGRALAKSQNYNIAFKEWSTEFFYDRQDGAAGSPFSPVDNGFTRIGCANGFSVADVDGALCWIAQTKQEGRSVYLQVGLEQAKVSDADIDRILNADDFATVHAYGLQQSGHSLYLLTLVTSNITLVYDLTSKRWYQWSSLTPGSSVSVSSITRNGTTATVTTSTAHTLSDGDPVLMAGTDQTEYNGIFQAAYVSSTVFTIEVSGSPTTPATGTITAKPYTETYFKFTKAMSYNGVTYLLHESDGHLYQVSPSLYRDAGIPINWFARTTRMDGGSTDMKRMAFIEVIGDKVSDIAMVRWSDDDCGTFVAYRVIDLSREQPITNKCGGFRRRTLEYRHTGNTGPVIKALELEIT